MRETLANMTATMEQIAGEADTNQRMNLKDGLQRVGGYGQNS